MIIGLEVIAKEEFSKIQFPTDTNLVIKMHSELYPVAKMEMEIYHIQFDIGLKLYELSNRDVTPSFLYLLYHTQERVLEIYNIDLNKILREQGYDRKLLEAVEKIGRRLKCCKFKSVIPDNPKLLMKMGYEKVSVEGWEKLL